MEHFLASRVFDRKIYSASREMGRDDLHFTPSQTSSLMYDISFCYSTKHVHQYVMVTTICHDTPLKGLDHQGMILKS